jgi:hypothetical protein
MGSFFSPGKNEYYWRFLEFLQDENVYPNDRQVIPYTPAQPLVYTDLFPGLYTAFPLTTLNVFINDRQVAQGQLSTPDGLFYVAMSVPKDEFFLEVRTPAGKVLRRERYSAKNFAMFFDVAAQSYEDRRIEIEQVRKDQSFATIRTGRIYPVVGASFDFPPPAGWSPDEYRATILGDGLCKPGFVKAFFHGGTLGGILDAVRSIIGCDLVEMVPVDEGKRWVLYDRAEAPDPVIGGPNAWYITDVALTPPKNRIVLNDAAYFTKVAVLRIHGGERVVVNEPVLKASNSFIAAGVAEPYVLAGKNLVFTVEDVGDPTTWMQFSTTFGALTTTAAQAAADILLQNPMLGPAVYADGATLRVGVPPTPGKVRRVTIKSGTALAALGWAAGQFVDVGNDRLANIHPTTPVTLTYGGDTFTDGVEFEAVQATGEIVWDPSSPTLTNVPPAGATMLASYSYVPEREVREILKRITKANDQIELEWV